MDTVAETRSTITMKPNLRDYRGLLKALNVMDDEAKITLKNEVYSISSWTAQGIQQAAYGHPYYPAQAAIVAATVRPARDRLPTVVVGGSKGRASGGAGGDPDVVSPRRGGVRSGVGAGRSRARSG